MLPLWTKPSRNCTHIGLNSAHYLMQAQLKLCFRPSPVHYRIQNCSDFRSKILKNVFPTPCIHWNVPLLTTLVHFRRNVSGGGQSVSTSGSVGSQSSQAVVVTTPASDSTHIRLNHLDIHADDSATTPQDAAAESVTPLTHSRIPSLFVSLWVLICCMKFELNWIVG